MVGNPDDVFAGGDGVVYGGVVVGAGLAEDSQRWEGLPTRRVWLLGHEAMYGARSVQVQDCSTPTSNHTGIGKRPWIWRKIICWRALVVMDWVSRVRVFF